MTLKEWFIQRAYDTPTVTSVTNIGWTPMFPRLAAVVTDVGSTLSHAAILAREMGIPAVVGCGNATMLLKTGDRVRVDGGRGIVDILSRQSGPGWRSHEEDTSQHYS